MIFQIFLQIIEKKTINSYTLTMQKTLFIGSTCADVIINVPFLPAPGKDENILSQKLSAGGCAFNVSSIVRQFGLPYILCSPVGSGIYGDFIEKRFAELGIPVFVKTPELENGCCYCIVESNARRTFLCQHGAEYRFNEQWFSNINFSEIDIIYFCGLEIEDVDGAKIISFLEQKTSEQKKLNHEITLFFAPGPRINNIQTELLSRIFALKPILHLNDEEAVSFTKQQEIAQAAQSLTKLTGNSVIITEGKDGAFCYDKKINQTASIPCQSNVKAIDTTGAGDCHCGTIIASLKQGYSLFDSVKRANVLAAYIVTQPGSTIPEQKFQEITSLL